MSFDEEKEYGEVNNIDDLRNHALLTIEKLTKKQISTAEAGVTAKLYENVMSSLRAEMEYYKLTGRKPVMVFLENDQTHIGSKNKLLEHDE